jgi:hypothetical protein
LLKPVNSFLRQLAAKKQSKAKHMPPDNNRDSQNPDLLKLVANAMARHEKETDYLINKLRIKKNELATCNENLKCAIDKITKKVDTLQDKIKELKNLLLPT